jgi:hypothetical protein
VQVGSYLAQANGGSGGDGSIGKAQGEGGIWVAYESTSLGGIGSGNGSAGATGGKSVPYTDPTPEGGNYTTEAAGAGGTKGGAGYGAGGNGGNGFVKVFY